MREISFKPKTATFGKIAVLGYETGLLFTVDALAIA